MIECIQLWVKTQTLRINKMCECKIQKMLHDQDGQKYFYKPKEKYFSFVNLSTQIMSRSLTQNKIE